MSLKDLLLPEFDQEMMHTRRLLERVPLERSDWKPHPKSTALGELASHVVNLLTWAAAAVERDEFDVGAPDGPTGPGPADTVEELLSRFDKTSAMARSKLESLRDEDLMRPWTLRAGERVMFTQPKFLVLRTMVFSHHIHHRAQLGLYLRLNDVALPPIFGPTADESV